MFQQQWCRKRSLYRIGTLVSAIMLISMLAMPSTPVRAETSTTNTFNVINTNDSGPGSLRAAILSASSAGGTINFNIPKSDASFNGTVWTIRPQSVLPTLTNAIILDGATQTTFGGDTNPNGPEIVIDGSLIPNFYAIPVSGDGNRIANLVINGSKNAAAIGITYTNDGTPSNNVIENNYLGTDPAGMTAIADNRGIEIHGYGSPSSQADSNVIHANLVSGNTNDGILLCDASHTHIFGNLIGTNRTGTGNLGNGLVGIHTVCAGVTNSLFESNTIAYNGAGIIIEPDYRFSSTGHNGNRIHANSIFSNGTGLGINLYPAPFGFVDQVTANDAGDGDSGANALQNFPLLSAAISDGSNATVTGTLNGWPNQTFTIELFANDVANPSGYGEGQTFLSTVTVATDAAGNASFSAIVPRALRGDQFVTATAIDADGNTSEFSAALKVAIQQPATPRLTIADAPQRVLSGTIRVPVVLKLNGEKLGAVAFSLDYDQHCLTFDPSDHNADGLPDALSGWPNGFTPTLAHDSDGNLEITLSDLSAPIAPLPAGTLMTLTLSALQACNPGDGSAVNMAVNFSSTPAASFGSTTGASVLGSTQGAIIPVTYNRAPVAVDDLVNPNVQVFVGSGGSINVLANDYDPDGDPLSISSVGTASMGTVKTDGKVVTYDPPNNANGVATFSYKASDGELSDEALVTTTFVANDARGDCNADGHVDAGDFVAVVLEIFDEPANAPWYEIYKAGFPGSPQGCDANADHKVEISDAICTSRIFFGKTCEVTVRSSATLAPTQLTVNYSDNEKTPTAAVGLSAEQQGVAAVAFRLHYDPKVLKIDTTDKDNNGVPDAVSFSLPTTFQTWAMVDNSAGELQVAVANVNLPVDQLASAEWMHVAFERVTPGDPQVKLQDLSASDFDGQALPVTVKGGPDPKQTRLYLSAIMN